MCDYTGKLQRRTNNLVELGELLQNVTLGLKQILKTVLFSLLILPCLFCQTLVHTANMVTALDTFTADFTTVFPVGNKSMSTINSDQNGPFMCYKCGAYRHRDGDDFDIKYKECRDLDTSRTEKEDCSSFVAGHYTKATCRVTIDTIKSHVTSFCRGCSFSSRCSELRDCYDEKKSFTGVCRSCCSTPLCNANAPVHSKWSIPALAFVGKRWKARQKTELELSGPRLKGLISSSGDEEGGFGPSFPVFLD